MAIERERVVQILEGAMYFVAIKGENDSKQRGKTVVILYMT